MGHRNGEIGGYCLETPDTMARAVLPFALATQVGYRPVLTSTSLSDSEPQELTCEAEGFRDAAAFLLEEL